MTPAEGSTRAADDLDTSEDHLRAVFDSLDLDHDSSLDVSEMQAALRELGLPHGKNYVRDLLWQYDRDKDYRISFPEFKEYVESKEARLRRVFHRMDSDGDGQLDELEVMRAATALGLAVSPDEARSMVALLDRDGNSTIDYQEFRRFAALLPGAQVSQVKILAAWVDSSDWIQSMEYRLNHIPPSGHLERLFAGGVAGAVSRTVVAPLERLRTITMTDPSATRLRPVVARMWADGGVRGLFRGNMATVVKVLPSSAIQFAMYDAVKDVLLHNAADKSADLSHGQKFLAGLVSGAASCTATYPLEMFRTQIQVSGGAAGGYLTLLRGGLGAGGLLGLYRGFPVALGRDCVGFGLGYSTYEALCSLYKRHLNRGEAPSTSARGALGGLAACMVMTVTMPAENVSKVMRRLQVQGRPGFPRRYAGALDCVRQMLRSEGVGSFWRGSASSYMKVVPTMASTRLLYEALVAYGGIGGVRRYRLASEQGG